MNVYPVQEWFSKKCATSLIVFLSTCLSVSNLRRKCVFSLNNTRLLFSHLVMVVNAESVVSSSCDDDRFVCVVCLLVFIVCAWTEQEAEEHDWLQVRERALGDCRLGSGFHFLSPELQVGSCTPCQMLHSTDNFVSCSFYVLEAFSLRY